MVIWTGFEPANDWLKTSWLDHLPTRPCSLYVPKNKHLQRIFTPELDCCQGLLRPAVFLRFSSPYAMTSVRGYNWGERYTSQSLSTAPIRFLRSYLLVPSFYRGAEVGFAPTLEYAEVHETDPNRTCAPRQTAEVILITFLIIKRIKKC